MPRPLTAILALLLTVCAAAAPSTAPAPVGTGTITGHLIRDGGHSLGGLNVAMDGPAGRRVCRADSGGHYAFPGLPAGRYVVKQDRPSLFVIVTPASGSYAVDLADGATETRDFLNAVKPTGPPATGPAVVPVVTLPAEPTTAGKIVTDCGAAMAVRDVYDVGQVPALGWFDVQASTNVLADRRTWDAPGAVAVRVPRVGQVAAFEFDRPGTFTVTVSVVHPDGSTVRYAQAVVAHPDARRRLYVGPGGNDANAGTDLSRPHLSGAKLAADVAADTRVVLLPGWTGTTTGTIKLPANCVVEGVAAPDGTRPALTIGGFDAFTTDGGTRNALVTGLSVGGVGSPVQQNGETVPRCIGAMLANTHGGSNVGFVNCGLGTLDYGVKIEGGDGIAMVGCVQRDRRDIFRNPHSEYDGGRGVVYDNVNPGSPAEPVYRIDGAKSGCGWSYENNDLGQLNPIGKSYLTFRSGNGIVVANNRFDGGPFRCPVATSTTDGDGSRGNLTQNVLYWHNRLTRSSHEHVPHSVNITIDGDVIDSGGSTPEASLAPGAGPLSTFTIVNCVRPDGDKIKIKVKDWHALTAVPALFTDATITDAGGNVVRAATAQPAFTAPVPVPPPATQPVAPPATPPTSSAAQPAAGTVGLAAAPDGTVTLTLDGVTRLSGRPSSDGPLMVTSAATRDGNDVTYTLALSNPTAAAVVNPILSLGTYTFDGGPVGTLSSESWGNLATWGPARWYPSAMTAQVGCTYLGSGAAWLSVYSPSEHGRSHIFHPYTATGGLPRSAPLCCSTSLSIPPGGTATMTAVVRLTSVAPTLADPSPVLSGYKAFWTARHPITGTSTDRRPVIRTDDVAQAHVTPGNPLGFGGPGYRRIDTPAGVDAYVALVTAGCRAANAGGVLLQVPGMTPTAEWMPVDGLKQLDQLKATWPRLMAGMNVAGIPLYVGVRGDQPADKLLAIVRAWSATGVRGYYLDSWSGAAGQATAAQVREAAGPDAVLIGEYATDQTIADVDGCFDYDPAPGSRQHCPADVTAAFRYLTTGRFYRRVNADAPVRVAQITADHDVACTPDWMGGTPYAAAH